MPERLYDLTAQMHTTAATHDLMRYLSCLAATHTHDQALNQFVDRWPRAVNINTIQKSRVVLMTKAAVDPAVTTDPAWAGTLIAAPLLDAFLPVVRAASVLSHLPVRAVPFTLAVPWASAGGTFHWVREGEPKPVTKFAFSNLTVPLSKCAGIVALSEELARLTVPGSEIVMQRQLVEDITAFVDRSLLDPTNAGGPGQPAAITAGVTPIASTGDLNADLSALTAAFWTAHPRAASPFLIMSGSSASRVAAVRPHADVTMGGHVDAFTVAIAPEADANIIAMDAAALAVADQGLALDISKQAAVEMSDTPGAPTAATVVVSFWQHNLIGIRADRFVGWKVKPNTVQYLAGVTTAAARAPVKR